MVLGLKLWTQPHLNAWKPPDAVELNPQLFYSVYKANVLTVPEASVSLLIIAEILASDCN